MTRHGGRCSSTRSSSSSARRQAEAGVRRPARGRRSRDPHDAQRTAPSSSRRRGAPRATWSSIPGASPSPPAPQIPTSRDDEGARASNALLVDARPFEHRPSADGRGTADRLLLPRAAPRDGPARSRHRRTRRDLGAVSRLCPHRPRAGLRVVADLGRSRHHRHVRRDAVRRERHEVPLPRLVSRHDHVRRRRAEGEPRPAR